MTDKTLKNVDSVQNANKNSAAPNQLDVDVMREYGIEAEYFDKLVEIFQPGKSIRIVRGQKNPNNKKIHIRAIVDGQFVVFREWWFRKKYWNYSVQHIYFYYLLLKDDCLKK